MLAGLGLAEPWTVALHCSHATWTVETGVKKKKKRKGKRADLRWLWRWRSGAGAADGGVVMVVFLFLLYFSLVLLPLAFRLFYCSSSFFPFSPLVLEKEKPMVMLSFVCWFLVSLTFSSSLFLLPIPCSAASGSCGWCCRKVKLMVMFFFLFFSAGWTFLRPVLLAWSGSYVIFQTLFPHVAPVPPFCCSFFLCFCVFLSLLPPVSIISSPRVLLLLLLSPLFFFYLSFSAPQFSLFSFPFPSASPLSRPPCFFFPLSLPLLLLFSSAL